MNQCKCGHSAADHGINFGTPPSAVGMFEVAPVWCSGGSGHLCQCRHYVAFVMPAAS